MPDTAVQFELSYKPTKDRNKDAKFKFQRLRLVQTFRVHADQEGCTIAAVSTGKGGIVVHEAKFVTGGSYSILAAGGESMLKNLIFRGLKKKGEGWRAAFRDTNADKDMFISMEWHAVAIRMLGSLWDMMPDEKLPHEDVVRELIKARQIIETKEKPLCETRLPAVIFALNAKVETLSTEVCDHGSYQKCKVKVEANGMLCAYADITNGAVVLRCSQCERCFSKRGGMIKHILSHTRQAAIAIDAQVNVDQPKPSRHQEEAPEVFQQCFKPHMIKWQPFLRCPRTGRDIETSWDSILSCPDCTDQDGAKLLIKEYSHISVLDLNYRFALLAPRLQCKRCRKVRASHREAHLQQVDEALKSGAAGVNVQIVHITGRIFVTSEAFIHITTLFQGQPYAVAARRWEELHLDYIRSGFAQAMRHLPTTKMSEDGRDTMHKLYKLYEQLCAGGLQFHKAAEDLEWILHSVKAHGLQRLHAAATYASAILRPSPKQDAAHDVGSDNNCARRKKTACPSRYTVAEAQRLANDQKTRQQCSVSTTCGGSTDSGLCL